MAHRGDSASSPANASGAVPAARRLPAVVYVITGVLLLSQFVALLWVSSYAKVSPKLGGFPFFYWYSILWLLIGAVEMAIAFVLVRHYEEDAR